MVSCDTHDCRVSYCKFQQSTCMFIMLSIVPLPNLTTVVLPSFLNLTMTKQLSDAVVSKLEV